MRWYLRFSLSLRDLEELMAERGLAVDHTSIWRWVQAYAPEVYRQLHGSVAIFSWSRSDRAPFGSALSLSCTSSHSLASFASSAHVFLEHLLLSLDPADSLLQTDALRYCFDGR